MATSEAAEHTIDATKTDTSSPDPAVEASERRKRKSKHTEIEVDLAAPEPPSKKARRALRKGKDATAKKPTDDDDLLQTSAKKKKAADQAENPHERSEHSIWVGNLPYTATKNELRQWLVDNSGGVIADENITRLHLPAGSRGVGKDKNEKANKGYAYVDFSSVEAKVAAMALSETNYGTRRVLIKDSHSFEGRPAKAETEATEKAAKREDDKHANRKIFVGNLGFSTTEDDVWTLFQKCGEIDWVKIATFEDTDKCKGFGWVKFKEAKSAEWAAKGFVKIKEPVETEEDFMEPHSEEEGDGAPPRVQKMKKRKWWVNRLKGRELKIEMAEEDQVRYKKRNFGKGTGQKDGRATERTKTVGTASEDVAGKAADEGS